MTDTSKSETRSFIAQIVRLTALCMAAFQIYTAQFGLFSAMVQRPIHLAFACTLVLLLIPINRQGSQRGWGISPDASTSLTGD